MGDAPFLLGKGGWLIALVTAALLHIGVAVLVFWAPSPPPQGQAVAAGTGGVEIVLGPAGRSAGRPETTEGEEKTEEAVQPEAEPKPQPNSAEAKPEPEPEPKPQPEPEPQLEPSQAPEPEAQALEPEVQPQASVAGAAGQSGTQDQDRTGSGDNAAGGGLPGDTRDYAATLLAWLEQHKEYPRRARMRRQQGTVLLYFVVDRQGKVLDHRIEQSSGHPALDEEVLRMLQRAQPLPAMLDSMQKDVLELVVPVQFFLR